MKLIKDLLPESISYGEISCVINALESAPQQKAVKFNAIKQQIIIDCVVSMPGQLTRSGIAKVLWALKLKAP